MQCLLLSLFFLSLLHLLNVFLAQLEVRIVHIVLHEGRTYSLFSIIIVVNLLSTSVSESICHPIPSSLVNISSGIFVFCLRLFNVLLRRGVLVSNEKEVVQKSDR